MNLDGLKARLGSISPWTLERASPAIRRLITEDLPKLIEIASYARSLLSEEGVFDSVSHLNVAFALKEALRLEPKFDGDIPQES